MPKIRRSLKNNGSPEPAFFTDGARQSFWIEVTIHPEFLRDHASFATPHVGRQVERQTAKNILTFCQKPRKASEIRAFLGLKDREIFQNNYLRPLMDEWVITLTIPNKPQSRLQQYITTEKGIQVIKG